MPEYKDRLAASMKRVGVDVRGLAAHLEITYTAVKKVVDGKSAALSASNNAKAAKFLGVRSDWLAIGDGDAQDVADKVPFRDLDVFEGQLLTFFRQLKPDVQHAVVVRLNEMVKTGKASKANPFPDKKGPRGISIFGGLDGSAEEEGTG